jgi:FOG: WD40-like repeat
VITTVRRRIPGIVTALLLGATATAAARAQDWPQWRGPARDGRLSGPAAAAPERWLAKPARAWKVPVGVGHSSPLIVGDAVYVFAREGDSEVTRRLDLTTGKEQWQDRYAAPYEMNPAARGHGKGPKSTPLYADGRLYTFGIGGTLSCLDARTGKVVWRHDFAKEHKETSPAFGTAMSPVIEKGLVIAHVGGNGDGALTAFDAKTGAARWRWTGDGPAYASPLVLTLGGVRQVVTQTQKRCVGIDAATGKLLWEVPFTTAFDQNSVTPVAAGDLIVFGGMRQPTFAVRARKAGADWTAEKVWQTPEATFYMSTPVLSDGKLFGMSERRGGQMFCLDAATGKVLWSGEGRLGDNASVWDVGGYLLTLTTGADLIVYKKGADGALTEAARHTVAESPVWASPAVAPGGRLLVKDLDSLALWTLPPSPGVKAASR